MGAADRYCGRLLAYTLIGHYFLPPTRTITSGWWPLLSAGGYPPGAADQLAAFWPGPEQGRQDRGDPEHLYPGLYQSAEGETESDAYLTMAGTVKLAPYAGRPEHRLSGGRPSGL